MLIISDLRMPVTNGLQLLKTVKDLNPLIRTILMTAFQIDDRVLRVYYEKDNKWLSLKANRFEAITCRS
jgi:CheY-like chemotaxis protein